MRPELELATSVDASGHCPAGLPLLAGVYQPLPSEPGTEPDCSLPSGLPI